MTHLRVTRTQSRQAAREWRVAEALLQRAADALDDAERALVAGGLATRQQARVRALAIDVRNVQRDVGWAAAEEERAAAR